MAENAISREARSRKERNESYRREIAEILKTYQPKPETMRMLNNIPSLKGRLLALKMTHAYGLRKLSAELERLKDVQ